MRTNQFRTIVLPENVKKPRGCKDLTAKLAMVNADFEDAKSEAIQSATPHSVSIRIWEKRWKLKRGQLANFRANLPRKKTPLPDPIY